MTITTADAIALGPAPPPHRSRRDDVEIQVDDHKVVVSYGGEPRAPPRPGVALQFVEALLAGRVDIEVHRGLFWRTTRSYLDGSRRPFLVTRMPCPRSSRRRGDRTPQRVGFGA